LTDPTQAEGLAQAREREKQDAEFRRDAERDRANLCAAGCGREVYLFASPVCDSCTRKRHRKAVGA
jgi:hypothetical protein